MTETAHDLQTVSIAVIETYATGTRNSQGQLEGAWLDTYLDLCASGLHWKKAAFAAWFNAPKGSRKPATMRELAELLNYKSEQVFYKWQNADWFRESGIEHARQAIFRRYIADIDRKTIASALTEDGSAGVAARKLFYEQAKLAAPVKVDVSLDSAFERALKQAYGNSNEKSNT